MEGMDWLSVWDFLQQLPHEDAVSSNDDFVQDFSFRADDFEGSLQSDVHENVNANDDAFDLSATIELDS